MGGEKHKEEREMEWKERGLGGGKRERKRGEEREEKRGRRRRRRTRGGRDKEGRPVCGMHANEDHEPLKFSHNFYYLYYNNIQNEARISYLRLTVCYKNTVYVNSSTLDVTLIFRFPVL